MSKQADLYPFSQKVVVYGSKGWADKILSMWQFTKLTNCDMKGWSYAIVDKIGKKFGRNDSAKVMMFRGFVQKDGVYHTKVEITTNDEDGWAEDTVETLYGRRGLFASIDEQMKIRNSIKLGFGYETFSLNDSDVQNEVILVKKMEWL